MVMQETHCDHIQSAIKLLRLIRRFSLWFVNVTTVTKMIAAALCGFCSIITIYHE